ncbi:MAG: 1-deoxy-D-xylulose-5-phosphate reductoisomerase [Pseudomonadota bacterium]
MKKISILGSTGSIGTNVLNVVREHPDKFEVVALAEGHDVKLLSEQIKEFCPRLVSVRDEAAVKTLRSLISDSTLEIKFGIDGACDVATIDDADMVVSAIVGSIGLKPTLAALNAGKDVALANKESLVMGGKLVMDLVKEKGVKLLPVDSEHSAIFQSLTGHNVNDVERLILTASGGPFRGYTYEMLQKVTRAQALKHPRWEMGSKITIDSATLMNKGLEVIEAHWLFKIPSEKIDVVIHPQSIVHSLVEYCDGCVVAELGEPDMRSPIAYALSFPERINTSVKRLNLAEIQNLTFEKPDRNVFKSLKLAYDALASGGTMPTVLNSANEVAVGAFLNDKIKFIDIPTIVEKVMSEHDVKEVTSLETLFEADRFGREKAHVACGM